MISDKNINMFIILSYLGMIILQFVYSIVSKGIEKSIAYLLVLIMYSIIVFFTHRGNRIARWIINISVLLSGISTFLVGVFYVTADQAIMKGIFIFVGLYFTIGGIKLLCGWRAIKGESKKISL